MAQVSHTTIKRGATRAVILVGSYAFKLPSWQTWPSFLRGLLANMEESAFSRLGHPLLCPVVGSLPGGLLVVMRRARPLSAAEFAALDFTSYQQVTAAIEAKQDSFGWLQGQIVAVDYG